VLFPSKENHYNSSTISEQTLKQNVNNTAIAFTAILLTPSDPSKTLASLDSNDKDERNRQEELFICPKFISNLEIKYQRHIVLKHPGKPGIQIKQQ